MCCICSLEKATTAPLASNRWVGAGVILAAGRSPAKELSYLSLERSGQSPLERSGQSPLLPYTGATCPALWFVSPAPRPSGPGSP